MSQQNNGGAASPDIDLSKAAEANADEAGKAQEGAKPNDGAPANDPAAAKAEPAKGKSLAELAGVDLNNDGGGDDDDKNPDEGKKGKSSVLSELIETRKENREMRALLRDEVIPTIKQLQEQVKAGGTTAAAAKDELDELAEEFELDPKFVKKLATTLENKTAKSIENKYLGDIKDIKAKGDQQTAATQAARVAKAVDLEIERVIKDRPEFAKIANPAAIKKYVLADQSNLGKNMDDIFEEIYGGAVKDPASIDGYAGAAANNPKPLDYSKLDDEGHQAISKSRQEGGKEFEDYQNDLLDRLQFKSRSRHAK